jgi:hypothetical protein
MAATRPEVNALSVMGYSEVTVENRWDEKAGSKGKR